MSSPARRILLVTLEPISKRMAGPAIRCIEIAKQLAKNHQVTVFSPYPSEYKQAKELSELANFNICFGTNKSHLYEIASQHDILFLQANVLKPYPKLSELGKYLVVDLYDPYLLAILTQFANDDSSATASYGLMHQVLEHHMLSADFTVCASEKQLDYWLGRFCALGRLTPEMYHFDRSFRKLIDVVPFGLPQEFPQKTGPGIKGKIPGISNSDFVLLWGGGVWEWFDPLTVIRAVAALSKKYPQIKLYFMGFKSPNPQVPLMNMATAAKNLAQELGLENKNVFFSESWTPYEERVNYLLDADLAVSAHFDLPETRFSFRTRMLDYLWAGLPILTSHGDEFASLIEQKKAGMALPYEDVSAWTNAIEKLVLEKDLKASFSASAKQLSEDFHWHKTVEPLQKYCASPYHLPMFKPVRMPSVLQRAKAIYSRGGKDLFLKRAKEIVKDFIRG